MTLQFLLFSYHFGPVYLEGPLDTGGEETAGFLSVVLTDISTPSSRTESIKAAAFSLPT